MNAAAELTEAQIDRLRVAAFRSNAEGDRQAYFNAVSKWFQDRHYREMDRENANGREATIHGREENRPTPAGPYEQGPRDGEGTPAGSRAASNNADHEHGSATISRVATVAFDSKCYDLASAFLEDEPSLFTDVKCCELAALIQQAIEDFIGDEKGNFEPPDPAGFEAGFAGNH